MGERLEGVVWTFMGIAVLSMVISFSVAGAQRNVRNDCVDYGKTTLNGVWYHCGPVVPVP